MAAKINKYVSVNKLSSKVYFYKYFALIVIATDVNNIFLIYDLCIMFVYRVGVCFGNVLMYVLK